MELSYDCYENEIVGTFLGFMLLLNSLEYLINLRMLKVRIYHIFAELSGNFNEVEIAGIFLGLMQCLINPVFVTFKYSSVILKL